MSEDTHNSENKLEWPDVMGIGPNYRSELTKLREQVGDLRDVLHGAMFCLNQDHIPTTQRIDAILAVKEVLKRTNPNADVKQAFPTGRW